MVLAIAAFPRGTVAAAPGGGRHRGDAITYGVNVTYQLPNNKTTLTTGVSRTSADNRWDNQGNYAYRFLDAYVGVQHDLSKRLSLTADYTYSQFGERGNNDMDNYKAHKVVFGMKYKF